MMKITMLALTIALSTMGCTMKQTKKKYQDYPVQPVAFTQVQIDDNFWLLRIEANRTVTIPYDFKKCEETGRIDNFAIAGGLKEGKHKGIRFNDSDVFKVIEGAAYSLNTHWDDALDQYLDDLIEKIGAAQEEDGYIYTTRTIDPDNPAEGAGQTRWSNLKDSHELYNVGHMIEAAVAHYQATGKRSFLDIAIKSADLFDRVFGPDKLRDVPGHQEIEIGLAKLYRITGEEKYLNLAKFFLNERGHANNRNLYGVYYQDHKPVLEQTEPVGHAVRAAYMYSGMADIAALTGDPGFVKAIDRIWENVATRRLYITGGIGARHSGEAFGEDYELPNLTAYCETCASIANIFWNHRMFLLHKESKYIDVLERVLYNGFLAGVSMDGNMFFYTNPLESDGKYTFNQGAATRQPWFGCACCPTNVVRFMPSLPGYVYAQCDDDVYVNLYIGGTGTIRIAEHAVKIIQQTRYPWDGAVNLEIDTEQPAHFALLLRIPGWAQDQPVPGDLYRFQNRNAEKFSLKVNGNPVEAEIENGYARIRRTWKKGDQVALSLPMPIRRVVSHANVTENAGKVALQRGPIVFCAEWTDNDGHVRNLVLPDDAQLDAQFEPDALNGIIVIRGIVPALYRTGEGAATETRQQKFTAIPYYAWSHRGEGEMKVWLPTTLDLAESVIEK
ncbi:glycoside hydrolase family 127 protein [candidate division KSB1 bacterium]|nr:glycoside hydrolase family 127 protein [candidate division KSB1 bacterium]